jgi:hypothetical protein
MPDDSHPQNYDFCQSWVNFFRSNTTIIIIILMVINFKGRVDFEETGKAPNSKKGLTKLTKNKYTYKVTNIFLLFLSHDFIYSDNNVISWSTASGR